ncbi:MAG: DNA methyltransferase [Candidatus Hodarchaeales archaeon]|jgi:DNA modification methylase
MTVDPRNRLNALTGKEWIRFTKSWFIADGKSKDISREIELHPASFPPPMIKEFIEFFTKPGGRVLDPFVGTGSTLVACDECGRQGVGIELYQKYVKTTQARTSFPVYQGDARKIVSTLKTNNQKFELCITSPPYWRILKKKKDYNQQERRKKGLDLQYGENPDDLGMIDEQTKFLSELILLFNGVKDLLTDQGHLVIFVQNIRDKGESNPLAFELGLKLRKAYKFLGERIWLQNQKTLRPYGYPYAFVPNIHHHYALIFQKR